MKKGLIYTAVLCLSLPVLIVAAETEKKFIGDESDGSRAVPVHLIPLIGPEGQKISPDDKPLLPFSAIQSCGGACHNCDTVKTGWHFNAVDPNVPAGRNGQPWILFDAGTGTQIPVSYRPWPGTFRPEQVGLTYWKFIQYFGRQTPGGGPGEIIDKTDVPDETLRVAVSGKLETNCLACHNANPGQDQSEYADQIARQNFRWATTASCGFASVSGLAAKMTDTFDYLTPDVKPDTPTVAYHQGAFDEKKKVLFDIVRKVPKERCYFCHSNKDINKNRPEKWESDEDVHLAAGLTCVDCHRNGLDHNITRGYEGEISILKNMPAALPLCKGCHVSKNPLACVSSCKGCHLPKQSSPIPVAGRLGAPVPKHPGIPPVHFDKLTCTACHSGPWPVEKAYQTKTSRAHRLGTKNVNKADDMLPHIMSPVFAKGYDGKIGPHKLFWPAFWAGLKDKDITPLKLEVVAPIAEQVMAGVKLSPTGSWRTFTEKQLTNILDLLSKEPIEGRPVYICGGELYRLDDAGKLSSQEHPAARPYLWPIAHDVRPAAQSLGVRGCEDCHSTDSPFFFGKVLVDSTVEGKGGVFKKMMDMYEFSGPVYVRVNGFFKWMIIVVMTLLIMHIIGDLYRRGLLWLAKRFK